MQPDPESVRLDKWLWAARFYKSRSLATAAIDAGHVRLNGSRVKPSHLVRVGERLVIARGGEALEVIIVAREARRGPASDAQTLYEVTEESPTRRQAGGSNSDPCPAPPKRPNKRDRRLLRDFLDR